MQTRSLIPRQLPASPMLVLARRIKHPLDVPVQGPQDADARKHRRASQRGDQDQGFRGSLPLRAGFGISLWWVLYLLPCQPLRSIAAPIGAHIAAR
jgi:hypothetical protein